MLANNIEAVIKLLVRDIKDNHLPKALGTFLNDVPIQDKVSLVIAGDRGLCGLSNIWENKGHNAFHHDIPKYEYLVAALIVAHPESLVFLGDQVSYRFRMHDLPHGIEDILLRSMIMGICRAVTVLHELNQEMPGLDRSRVCKMLALYLGNPYLRLVRQELKSEQSSLLGGLAVALDEASLLQLIDKVSSDREASQSPPSDGSVELTDNLCHKIFSKLSSGDKLLLLKTHLSKIKN